MDTGTEIALLKERLDNVKDQINRFTSHLESEQRVTGNISKRVDQVEALNKNQHDVITKHDRILLNDGKGLSFRIDRLERENESKKDSTRWTVSTIISVISLIASIVAIVIMMLFEIK